MKRSRKTVYGQVLGHSIIDHDAPKQRASKKLINHVTSGDAYIKWAHAAPGGMVPAWKSVTNTDKYRDNEILSAWGDTINQFTKAMENMERFDLVNGTLIPEFGKLTSNNLVSTAVNRVVIQGHDPKTVAKEQAKRMRNAL